nr:MAG: major capsid protein [Microvirus Sku211]
MKDSRLVQKQQATSNMLVNQSQRADTVVTNVSGMSTFDKSFQKGTTFDSGKLIPILCQEVYPSDTYDIDTNALLRLSAQKSTPFMNINYDVNYFFVPFDQIDPNFKNVMGENESYGFNDTNLEFPKLDLTSAKNGSISFQYDENDLGNYLDIPIHTELIGDEDGLMLYPYLAYGKIANDWYRDQNLQDNIDVTSCFNATRTILAKDYNKELDYKSTIIYGKGLAPASKLPSYYTTNLPYQQKGNPIPLGNFNSLTLNPLTIRNAQHPETLDLFSPKWYADNGTPYNYTRALQTTSAGDTGSFTGGSGSPNHMNLALKTEAATGVFSGAAYNITDIREAIVYQHLLENFALCGSRYVEQLKSIWGIEIDPKAIKRTELIGGYNDSLVYNNVAQTSASTETSRQGNIVTNLYNSIDTPHISYTASQHGYIIGILVVRSAINNGGQGMPKMFRHKDYLDLFNPLFNGISEQPTRNEELYYNATHKEKNKDTFGFNEPFIWTKYNRDTSNGFLSLKSKQSLFPAFLFGEKYTDESQPELTAAWMIYNPNIIGNTLYDVSPNTKEFYHQFISLITFNIRYTTKQPLFNSPRVYGI